MSAACPCKGGLFLTCPRGEKKRKTDHEILPPIGPVLLFPIGKEARTRPRKEGGRGPSINLFFLWERDDIPSAIKKKKNKEIKKPGRHSLKGGEKKKSAATEKRGRGFSASTNPTLQGGHRESQEKKNPKWPLVRPRRK